MHRVVQALGKRPTGYVAPWWEFSAVTNELLLERGIKYDHSLMHNDISPTMCGGDKLTSRLRKKPREWMVPLKRGHETDLIEIPASWYLDDLPPMMFIRSPRTVTVSSIRATSRRCARPVRLGLSRITDCGVSQ